MKDSNLIKSDVFALIKSLIDDKSVNIVDETPLIGEGSLLDSMKLIELCLALEDKSNELGFQFDWTSDAAMSKSRSMFRTAGSLSAEFQSQMELS